MSIIQVRDVPESVYQRLSQKAKKEHRSLSQQVIVELAKALNIPSSTKDRRAQVIDKIHQLHQNLSCQHRADPVKVIREDRDQ